MNPTGRHELQPVYRVLMGPGPSDVDSRVTRALSTPITGHLDPWFLEVMDGIREMLMGLFRTENATTLALPGTGTSGMECCLLNLLEPGDTAVIGIHGYFGTRMADIAGRAGARVVTVESDWGGPLSADAMAAAIDREKPKVVAFVHAETSTGVWQPVKEIAGAARTAGALVVLDCVTSLGGCPVEIDEWGVDAAYSGSQKCLSCPPGAAPVTFSPRAMEAVRSRKTKPASFYLDIDLLDAYWNRRPAPYHHTAPITTMAALYEALRIAFVEGLEKRFERHRRNHELLLAGIAKIGLESAAPAEHRLWMLNPIRVPDGVDEAAVRKHLLEKHRLEIGAGLGPLAGKIWRVGIMGASCTEDHVRTFLAAMADALGDGAR